MNETDLLAQVLRGAGAGTTAPIYGDPEANRNAALAIASALARPAKTLTAYATGETPEGMRWQSPDEEKQWMKDQALNIAMGSAGDMKLLTPQAVPPGGITAYHGSPHEFTQFSQEKIGTGEGAQAYGYGHYFAEEPRVAQQYAEGLTRGKDYTTTKGGKIPDWAARRISDAGDPAAAAEQLQSEFLTRVRESAAEMKAGDHMAEFRMQNQQAVADALGDIARRKAKIVSPQNMYTVNIRAKPEQFLDWDKPLSAQPPQVSGALNQILKPTDRMPADWIKSSPGAESRMRDAGIPGIRYLDQGSRGAGQGTHNYVVFDDKLIDIMKTAKALREGARK